MGLSEEKVLKSLVIGPDISTEMTKQAALFAQVAIAGAHAKNREEEQKLALQILEADLDKVARNQLIAAGEKIREAAVEAVIRKDPNWVNLNNAYLRERQERMILEAATEAFKQRAMMLSGLGAIKRAEMEQEQSILTKNVAGKATEVVTRSFNRMKEDGSS